MSPAAVARPLQRSPGLTTRVTAPPVSGSARREEASTEPGPYDPGDIGHLPSQRIHRLASTEPGPYDPGDETDGTMAAVDGGCRGGASTEPGPYDPGDSRRRVRERRRVRAASTEPGPYDPGDWLAAMLTASCKRASTEPGPYDPGDKERTAARHEAVRASTEPGPYDPGDTMLASSRCSTCTCFNGARALRPG